MSRTPTPTRSPFEALMRRTGVGLLTLVSLLGLARGAVLATSAAMSLAVAPVSAGASQDDATREYWQKQYRNLTTLVVSLTQELEEARADYARKRRDRRLRGETRIELLDRIAQLEKRLAKAERDLQEFPDRARAAGALPGWFRD